jgi:hypothetical protein
VKVTYVCTSPVRYYRFALPVAMAGGAQTGKWVALLRLDERLFTKLHRNSESEGVRYSLTALAWPNLRLRARSTASESTTTLLSITVVLEECVVLVSHRANEMLQLKEGAPGNFKTSMTGKPAGSLVPCHGEWNYVPGPAIYEETVSCAVSYQDDADVDWKRSWALEGTESGAVGGEGVSGGFIAVMAGGSAHSHRFLFQIVP